MTTSCLFCRIGSGELSSSVVFEDERVLAFDDLHPAAPVHVLIVPKKHLTSVNDAVADDEALLGHLFVAARAVAAKKGVAQSGYRVVMNTGEHAGQSVHHMHLHVLGGRDMEWPPG